MHFTTDLKICLTSLIILVHTTCAIQNGSNRQTRAVVLEPGKLFECVVGESKLYAQRKGCQQNFNIQESKHHCATRRLTMMKIDRQLSRLEKSVFYYNPQKMIEDVSVCREERAAKEERVLKIRDKIAASKAKADDFRRSKQEKTENIETLAGIRDQLRTEHKRMLKTTESLRENVAKLASAVRQANITLGGRRNTNSASIDTLESLVNNGTTAETPPQTCQRQLNHTLQNYIQCSSADLPYIRDKLESYLALQDKFFTAKRNASVCQANHDECEAQLSACTKAELNEEEKTQDVVERQQNTTQNLDKCVKTLEGHERELYRCEEGVKEARELYHIQLVNITKQRLQKGASQRQGVDCMAGLKLCEKDRTACVERRGILEGTVFQCQQKLHMCRLLDGQCDRQLGTVRYNVSSLGGQLHEMEPTLEREQDAVEKCKADIELHKRDIAQAKRKLRRNQHRLNTQKTRLDNCFKFCPSLKPT